MIALITHIYEYNHISKQNFVVKILALFYILTNLFNIWLGRRQLDSPISFCLWAPEMLFTFKHMKKIWPNHRYVIKQEEHPHDLFMLLSILHPNSTRGNFLKVSCILESETLSIIFSHELKSTHLPYTLNGLWHISDFLIYIGNMKILLHWIMQIISMLTDFII